MEEPKARPESSVSTMPMVPLRDIVVFPHTMVPFVVGRKSSLLAVERALSTDKKLFLAADGTVTSQCLLNEAKDTLNTRAVVKGGIVTEVGGWLSHAAIVARECGLTAIVSVRGACDSLETGQLVRLTVDGSIELIEEVADTDQSAAL